MEKFNDPYAGWENDAKKLSSMIVTGLCNGYAEEKPELVNRISEFIKTYGFKCSEYKRTKAESFSFFMNECANLQEKNKDTFDKKSRDEVLNNCKEFIKMFPMRLGQAIIISSKDMSLKDLLETFEYIYPNIGR